ncbi:probable 28S ribosomal protein S16, mitochondrial isoform X1 [Zootermopsis nevadensis]|uniref:Small ribosomal subunit protein bS16m n=1 Tax=Zootermopsis nevadensis TaxID=136037 RepID=A0A067QQJ1_ZOONE|nr:probable 28S ribosomal protein S16, mitochondrial isoform X1 [Zootermopsis nevadensis]KDR12174.1 putative 28S ribosomal protein S16, mitochondrial [Zootermopsis nevadensis]
MPFPASGGGAYMRYTPKIIRFARHGCTNRPFFHIVVMEKRFNQHSQVIEQLGTYDPLGNQYNERLVALNFERVRHWLGRGADTSYPVAELLGLCGFFPIHPRCYMSAWRNRKAAETEAAAQEAKSEGQEKT